MPTTAYSTALQDRADLIRESEAVYAKAKAEGRNLTADERKRDDEITDKLGALAVTISEEEARRAAISERGNGQALPGDGRAQQAAGPRYAQMFGAPRDAGGFKSLGDFLAPLQAGAWDERYNAMLGGPGDSSGSALLVPEPFTAALMDAALESEVVRPRATPFPMTSDTLRIGGYRVGDGGEPYGITASWTGPGRTITEANPEVRSVLLTANALKALLQITQEQIDDTQGGSGPSADQQLSAMLPAGIGWHVDHSCLRGTGAGQPQGMLTTANPARVLVAKETGQEADTIFYENVAAMWSRLHPSCAMRAIWLAHPSTLPQLLTLSIPIGLGGQYAPVLMEGPTGYSMFGRPVVISEKASPLGDEGDLSLLDISQYAYGARAGLRLEKSAHAGFATDSVFYRCVIRMDGKSRWTEPYSPVGGAPTLSPFVVLAERS